MSTLLVTPTEAVTSRISTRFSADGTLAACLAADRPHMYQPEVWTFTAGADRRRLLPTADGETLFTQLLPLPRERALLIRHRDTGHHLVLLTPDGSVVCERRLATVSTPRFRLLAGAGHRALALSRDGDRTAVWHVDPAAGRLEQLAEVSGALTGGAALDPAGRMLGFTRHGADGPTAVCLDLATGAHHPLAGSGSHLLLADPASGLAVLAVPTGDGLRLAYRHPHGAVTVPARLNAVDGTVRPLAVSPGGQALALQVRRGARTHLYLHRVADDQVTEADIPAGLIGGTGAWSATGLRFPYSSPVCPSGIAAVTPGTPSWRLSGADPVGAWRRAHLERFAGPAGQIEAVVYGDWRTAERVVLALHGGPDAAWELDFDPLFQQLAAAGLAVVAPNQRGSTGYGEAHASAIHGAWGGPDREDICHLGVTLRQQRPAGAAAPALYGASYGAYLALLAAAHVPDLWSRCAVVAPFLSGTRLYEEATPEVRDLIDRLGGRSPLPNGAGDVLTVADRIRVPLLVIHGSDDDTVPVGQSRKLRDRLLNAGRREGSDFRYLEAAGAGHYPPTCPGAENLTAALVAFLQSRDAPRELRDRSVTATLRAAERR